MMLHGSSLFLRAQDSSTVAFVEGVVRDSSGTPVEAAFVYLDPGRDSSVNAVTDAKGAYRLKVSAGRASLRIGKNGYRDAQAGPFDLAPGQTKNVDVTLVRRPVAQAPDFYDEPQFTVAGVADIANHGGHGSDTVSRTAQTLAKEVASSHNAASDVSRTSRSDEESLRTALARNPGDFETNRSLGVLLVREGKAREAAPYLERAHGMEPADYLTSLTLVRTYAQVGELNQAAQTAQALLSAHDTAELRNLLGDIEEKQGQSLKAVQDYQHAAELDPSESNLFDWGAELLLHRAMEPALQVFNKGSRLHPESVRMLVGLGVAQYASGSPALAAQTLCRASDLEPQNASPYLMLGKMQALDPAGSSLVTGKMERFAQLHPENAMANYYFAVSLLRKAPTEADQLTRIASLLKTSIGLDPKFAPAHFQLGVVHEAQKRLPVAIADYQQALALDPQLVEAHYRLAQAYRRVGEKGKAEQELALSDQASRKAMEKAEQDSQQIPQFVYTLRHPDAPSR